MCWRCDEPEEPLHDRHFWSAKDTLHEHHVREWKMDRLDKHWAKLGFQRVDFSKLTKFQEKELVVQPMVDLPVVGIPPPKFDWDGFQEYWGSIHAAHVSMFTNRKYRSLGIT
jgi:hypothetical protein